MKINRNLDEGMLEHYADLLGRGVLDEELGSYHAVSFTGEHVIKSPIEDNPEKYDRFRKSLFKEYRKGLNLEERKLNVPRVNGAYLVKGELPFLVMERKRLVNYRDLAKSEKNEFDRQYGEQIKLAKKNNIVLGDVCKEFNCGYDRKRNEVVFYDFEDWEMN